MASSTTGLQDLPNELLYAIMENLDSPHTLFNFSSTNKRHRQLLIRRIRHLFAETMEKSPDPVLRAIKGMSDTNESARAQNPATPSGLDHPKCLDYSATRRSGDVFEDISEPLKLSEHLHHTRIFSRAHSVAYIGALKVQRVWREKILTQADWPDLETIILVFVFLWHGRMSSSARSERVLFYRRYTEMQDALPDLAGTLVELARCTSWHPSYHEFPQEDDDEYQGLSFGAMRAFIHGEPWTAYALARLKTAICTFYDIWNGQMVLEPRWLPFPQSLGVDLYDDWIAFNKGRQKPVAGLEMQAESSRQVQNQREKERAMYLQLERKIAFWMHGLVDHFKRNAELYVYADEADFEDHSGDCEEEENIDPEGAESLQEEAVIPKKRKWKAWTKLSCFH